MIYFDNAATTKPSETALKKAEIFNTEHFYNPSSLYEEGLYSSNAIKDAKNVLLKSLGAINHEVIFTSCGSESDNLAVFGVIKKGVFLTDNGEHSAIYKSFLEQKNRLNDVVFISLNSDGSVNESELFDYVKNNRVDFVSIVHVNNETGAINDINKIAKIIKSINPKIIFHSDGVQAFGKIRYKLSNDIDLYSISAHKINALKGVGALIKKKNLNLNPIIFGGGQEKGYRSGTENLFGIKVFEYASLIHYENLDGFYKNALEIKNYIIKNLNKEYFKVISSDNSSPYILSISAVGLRGEVIMHSLEKYGIIIGNGSACSSKNRYSRVISACGYNNDVLDGMIRLSFSIDNTIKEAEYFIEKLNEVVTKLKGIM